MKKRIGMFCLSILILLPLAFSFSAVAADSAAIYPIPSTFCNRQYGTNMRWYNFLYQSGYEVYRSSIDLTTDEQKPWDTYWGDLGTNRVTRYEISDGDLNANYTFIDITIEFYSYNEYSKFFDLSSAGYVQFWFDLAVDGYDEDGYSVRPGSCKVYLFGNKTWNGEDVTSTTLNAEREYVLLTSDLYLAANAGANNMFRNCYFGLYGRTVTSSILRSSYINKIMFRVAFTSEVAESNLYLGDINYRRYDTDGNSLDTGAPGLDKNSQNAADAEGSIQNSINKAVDASTEQINNRIDDMVNDDMGYEKQENPETDEGLEQGNALLETIDGALADFDSSIDSCFTTMNQWLRQYKKVTDAFWNGIPTAISAIITAGVLFLVVRKVVGR